MGRDIKDVLTGLTLLHRVANLEEREAIWRQSLATLSHAVIHDRQPVPLEGLRPEHLESSLKSVVESGLLNRLNWISPASAAASVYELASALPQGPTRRALWRYVAERLHSGDASTFAAVATQIAHSSPKSLLEPNIRTSVSLTLSLPVGLVDHTQALALALISRKELATEWLENPSRGSLPQRVRAARLLEFAARETAYRALSGDDGGILVFQSPHTQVVWDRLLADREWIVWRHIAAAKGLLLPFVQSIEESVYQDLSDHAGITPWRRAATSIVASAALMPKQGANRAKELLHSSIIEKDPWIATAMVLGLPQVADMQPNVASELLTQCVAHGDLSTMEAVALLTRECAHTEFAQHGLELARMHPCLSVANKHTLTQQVLATEVRADLDATSSEHALPQQVNLALRAFATDGPSAARKLATKLLPKLIQQVEVLESATGNSAEENKKACAALRILDRCVFESDTIEQLLALDSNRHDVADEFRTVASIFARTQTWLLLKEGNPILVDGDVDQPDAHMQRLRALIHLVDADSHRLPDSTDLVRRQRLLAASILLERVARDCSRQFRRAICAALARSCDALIRENTVEVSDVTLVTAHYVPHIEGLRVLAEASMDSDLRNTTRVYIDMHRAVFGPQQNDASLETAIRSMQAITTTLPVAQSPRVEALRSTVLRLYRSLDALTKCGSLCEIVENTTHSALFDLPRGISQLSRLFFGTRERFALPSSTPGKSSRYVQRVSSALNRATERNNTELQQAVHAACDHVQRDVPGAFAQTIVLALRRILTLPYDAPRRHVSSSASDAMPVAPLPRWIPPNRTLGGYFIVRPIGGGAAGSVFVARRADSGGANATHFALKVPEFTGAVARTLSEESFHQMFRHEASALLTLRDHPNLARFITFDAGVAPKPILVMELIQGTSVQRLIDERNLDIEQAFDILQGIASGMAEMHASQIGHLDIKPSNIIVRAPHKDVERASKPNEAVLVDFGLAGRHVRLGCGSVAYCAPEIWEDRTDASVTAADVFSFGCLMYEVLTGSMLCDAEDDFAAITRHLTHDGNLPGVVSLLNFEPTTAIGKLIHGCTRRNPAERLTTDELLTALAKVRRLTIKKHTWPVVAPELETTAPPLPPSLPV